MTQGSYKNYAKLANRIVYRANKIANLNLDDASQCEVDYEEQEFYFALMKFINEIAEDYEHDPHLNGIVRHEYNVDAIQKGISKLL